MDIPTGSYIPGKPYLVTMFGAAGSGKSALAKAIVDALGSDRAARIPTDYFFVPRQPGEALHAYLAKPLAWDWTLLRERLSLPFGVDTTTPDADFNRFLRLADTGGRPFSIRPVMLIDAMAPFPDAHLVIRVHAPEVIRRERITLRDERWGTRVQDRWSHLEKTWTAVTNVTADLVLDGTRSVSRNVDAIVDMIGERGEVIR